MIRFMIQLEVAQASSRVSKVTLSCPEEKATFHERLDGTFFWAMIDKIMVLQLLVPKRKTLTRFLFFFPSLSGFHYTCKTSTKALLL